MRASSAGLQVILLSLLLVGCGERNTQQGIAILWVQPLRDHPVMREWWGYMKEIMETNADESPVQVELREVFYLA